MRLKVYEKTGKEGKEVILSLKKEKVYGNVVLCVVDEDGEPVGGGNLLKITSDGRISLCFRVSSRFGFDLGESGSLRLV